MFSIRPKQPTDPIHFCVRRDPFLDGNADKMRISMDNMAPDDVRISDWQILPHVMPMHSAIIL